MSVVIMDIFKKIKSFFSELSVNKKKSFNHIEKTDKPTKVNETNEESVTQNKIYTVTEASLCRTSYGICKLKDDGNKRYLIFPVRMEVRYIPFVENDCIEAVYTINPETFVQEKERFIYEIIDTAQFFMISKEQKAEIISDLNKRGIRFKFPEEINNYSSVMNILRESTLLMRNQDSGWFEKDKFLFDIMEIKGSNTYKELHLIRLKNGQKFLLIINQIIPNVIEYGPSFMNLYEPGAVKISYNEGYAFIVPFGKVK